ncbi:hypothetical protein DPMN_057471 [Dreissena polymorpha]|uniref:Uncharacterized protein n=1 Tax=Dreissena polymorpha TaxID=45954 RepID=A0A9D4HEV8_DREPO|nr:hypothetical protein DPMN_057471 [Dreissena polymorpha]
MTPDIESYVKLEAFRPKPIICTRTTTTIGTWNDQEDGTIGQKDVEVQLRNPRNHSNKMNWFLSIETDLR